MSRVPKSIKNESPIAHDITTTPWIKVAPDLFELKGKSYLVAVDYTTNIFDISLLPNKRSATVATAQKEFYPSLESLRKLCQIMDLNILERIPNCLQNNGTLNMPYIVLITQHVKNKLDKPFRQ